MRWVFKAFLDLATWNWRRPDVVLFINGLPLVVIELKNAADENATVWSAFQQLQTYKAEPAYPLRLQRPPGGL
jgi:type I site-specific restriction-modification system R (restriction) subunit